MDGRAWLSVTRQLVAQGYLLPDPEGHGGLVLGPNAGEVLRGQRELRFRAETPRGREAGRRRAAARTAGVELDPAAQALWTALRAWRLDEARRQELPPYVIFHDATLIEVARRRPASLDALAAIPGIGRSKLDRYGAAVLAVTADAA
jgi:ATP-dependent DNA helicase RecQ